MRPYSLCSLWSDRQLCCVRGLDVVKWIVAMFALVGCYLVGWSEGLMDGRKQMLHSYEREQQRCNCCHSAWLREALKEGRKGFTHDKAHAKKR